MYLGFPPFSLWRKYITPKQQIWRDFSEFSRKRFYGMFFGTSNETKQTNQRIAPRLYILSYFLLSNIQILIMNVLRSNVADDATTAASASDVSSSKNKKYYPDRDAFMKVSSFIVLH
jgi:hypothetical protein